MPGVGFLLGGAIAAVFSPRLSYAVAGAGVLVVLILAVGALRGVEWDNELEQGSDGDDHKTPAEEVSDAISVAQEDSSRPLLTGS
jgi:hypothetical protein